MKHVQHHESGFSLIGAVVSLAMVTIIGLVLAQFTSNASGVFTGVERNAFLTDSIEQLRLKLADRDACSLNLGGGTIDSPAQPRIAQVRIGRPGEDPIEFINNIQDKNGGLHTGFDATHLQGGRKVLDQSPTPFLATGVSYRGMALKSAAIKSLAEVQPGLHLAELQLKFVSFVGSPTNFGDEQDPKTQVLIRALPLMVVKKNGMIEECWARKIVSRGPMGSICASISNGAYTAFDEKRQTCGYANGAWIAGNERSASCPGGILPDQANSDDNCAVQYPAGWQDTFPKTSIPYSDGSTDTVARSPVKRTLNKTAKTCTCSWATDLGGPPAGAKCMIYCAVYQ